MSCWRFPKGLGLPVQWLELCREISGTPVPMDVIEYMLQEGTRTIVTLRHRTIFRRLFQALFPSLYDTWFKWSAVLSGCLKNSEYLTNNLKKPKRCIRGHEGNVENISRRRVFSGVFYHSVIHGLGFFLCFMIYAQNNKTRFFYVLHSDKTWVFTNQSACRALSML